jgi:glyoxylase-like metal-dependent hydrolase (beta-lactamase superfamily II)
MNDRITRQRDVESLKVAARWPNADKSTIVTLASRLAASHAGADGYRYFAELSDAQPDAALPLALAGFFQARLGGGADGGAEGGADGGGVIDAALAKLDRAAAADLGLPQYFRGLALTALPPDRGRAEQAVADLEFVLAVRDLFPAMLLRGAFDGLARAYAVLCHDDRAADAARRSGLAAAPTGTELTLGGFWANAEDGFRFTSPRILRPEPGIQVAQGYDFCDLGFITTADGVIAIDAGTTPDRVKTALSDLDLPAGSVISHLILTHAHWDHVGGADALRGPGSRVIAQSGFPAGLAREQDARPQFRYFTGAAGELGIALTPDQLVSAPTPLTVGGTGLMLYPTRGGETGDALLVHLPATGVLFAGDVLMPYLGQPFTDEGSPEGLLEALAFIEGLRPRMIIHGHPPLTDLFTAAAVPGLKAALTQLYGEVLDGIRRGSALADVLAAARLPDVLRDHPAAVVPYLVTRDNFAARLYHQRTGYWQPDGTGMEPSTAAERAAALDLLAGGREDRFADAAATLLDQGDHALALEIIKPGLLRYPASSALAELRRTALHRLMEQYQQSDPFKFLVYAEQAGVELGPVG